MDTECSTLRWPLAFIIGAFLFFFSPPGLEIIAEQAKGSHEFRVITILFALTGKIQSERETHEMFIYCFYRHVNHLNGNYVMKILRRGRRDEGECYGIDFAARNRYEDTTLGARRRKRFELSTTCDYM